ncbi:MAG: hypothetical protein EXR86_04295 [Gammaproteobacteria bacterium]|nr:hypothetical protein [Gammaproteobacteria bacterium]
MSVYAVDKLMSEARRLATEYKKLTGKTRPLSAEIAINDAVRLLSLVPVTDPGLGYDAVQNHADRQERCVIKARVLFDPAKNAHRLGDVKLDKPWDTLLVVLMNASYETTEIYAVSREAVANAVAERAEHKKANLTIAKIKFIGALAWAREPLDLPIA